MRTSKLVNVLSVAVATLLLVAAIAIGIPECRNIFECRIEFVRNQGILQMVAAAFLSVASACCLADFFRNLHWLRVAMIIAGSLGAMCNLSGSVMVMFELGSIWGLWLGTIAMTTAMSLTISVSLSLLPQKPMASPTTP
ncbi:unnamed protein product [Mesocestoides corti]|uniref:Uncharacterized protein n=1 Tax=Mesocestoides corti TaxID=53468 RepID=A0A0R3UAS7_MESCO|nr:unnamed protein product [Mesocestoides corti]